MRLALPQSLFARLLTAVVAVVGVAVLVIAILIIRERRDLALWGSGAWSAADSIADASAELARLDPDARVLMREKYRAEPLLIEYSRPRRPPQPRQDVAAIKKVFAHRISKQLGADYVVTITRADKRLRDVIPIVNAARGDAPPAPGDSPGPRRQASDRAFERFGDRLFDVSVGLPDGDQIVFRTLAPQPGPPLPRQIFVELGLVTLLLALVLYFMTRNITQPLSDLARAADAVGRGESHPPLAERGARELRDATRAFNTMQDRLHRYLDSRTRVLAAMSHDLRTPLTRLRLRAESIEDPDTQARFIADLDEMSQMVGGALNLFKGLNDAEVPTPVIVDDLIAALQAEYAELGASIAIEGHSNAPILAKPQALKRCLSNLLHNAVQYAGGAVVHIADGRELVVSIRDEGPGIPEEALEQVFEPFYRVESSRNRDSGGTGLGLSIARDIAQAHGGSIKLRNLPSRGLEAVVTLPRSDA